MQQKDLRLSDIEYQKEKETVFMGKTLIDISHIPFSCYGAYVSVVQVPGKYELDLHDVRQRFGADRAFRLFFLDKEIPTRDIDPKSNDIEGLPFELEATPTLISVKTAKGSAEICILGDYTLSVTAKGMNILMLATTGYGYGYARKDGRFYNFLFHDELRFGVVNMKKGFIRAEGPIAYDHTNAGKHPYDRGGNTLITVENGEIDMEVQLDTTEKRVDPEITKADALKATAAAWEEFSAQMPAVPEKHRAFAEVSWYNLWSCFVHARDRYVTDAMLMSKKFMSSLWSWDHCFNAIAMSNVDKKIALEQFFLPFTQQSPSGVLPDMYNPDMGRNWACTKPPIHGWAFDILMDRLDFTDEELRRAYDYLVKWTNYWFDYRDEDGDGIPGYPMGCDSGWDNATIFDTKGRFTESADLSAFLVLQMRCLGRISEKLGDKESAASWLKKSEELLQRMITHFWDGEKFVAKVPGTHEPITGTACLLDYMPLVLGDLLPKDIAEKTLKSMMENNLTEWGLATEASKSIYYEADGYWRGPIWAPPTYLIIDGLRRMGRIDEAKEIARRFTDLCAFRAKGNYENFDALTGTGLRAPGYTWTTSVYMELLWQYI